MPLVLRLCVSVYYKYTYIHSLTVCKYLYTSCTIYPPAKMPMTFLFDLCDLLSNKQLLSWENSSCKIHCSGAMFGNKSPGNPLWISHSVAGLSSIVVAFFAWGSHVFSWCFRKGGASGVQIVTGFKAHVWNWSFPKWCKATRLFETNEWNMYETHEFGTSMSEWMTILLNRPLHNDTHNCCGNPKWDALASNVGLNPPSFFLV